MRRTPFVIAVLGLALSACADQPQITDPTLAPDAALEAAVSGGIEFTGRYLVLGQNDRLPKNLERSVADAGGTLVRTFPEVGVAVAEAPDEGFVARAARIRGVESVAPDMILQWVDPPVVRAEGLKATGVIEDNAFFGSVQWAPQAIQAPEAWAAGFTGKGVRVAIVDGGIWNEHLDLFQNLDESASASFVPGAAYNEDLGTFWHGTHVAGIVAAKGYGIYGIAPDATLIGVKVLHGGGGAFEWVLGGILYAATPLSKGGAGADIINLSLGATLPSNQSELWEDKEYRDFFYELTKVHDRVIRYAYQQGVTVIVSAGNGGANYDQARDLYKIPAESNGAIAVSATGPHGWALYPADDFYRPTFYTDHGKSLVDVAAPGGTPGLFVIDGVDAICTVDGTYVTLTNFCETFDMVMSTIRGPSGSNWYGWAFGTSMAAPAASGVAALIIEANGGHMNPREVRDVLRSSAIDLGKPGKDQWYGHGWVNAYRAVMH